MNKFTFSGVFDESATQEDLFRHAAFPILEAFLKGTNGLLFAYGITNAGKTYTISGTKTEAGILPRIINIIFRSIHPNAALIQRATNYQNGGTRGETESSAELDTAELGATFDKLPNDGSLIVSMNPDCCHALWISYLEVHNERIHDLLVDDVDKANREILKLKEDKSGHPFVKGITETLIATAVDGIRVLEKGFKNRQVANNVLNRDSSRSHTVITFKLVELPKGEDQASIKRNPSLIRYSKLSIIDLAGSERNHRTNTSGARLKEAANINTSLMTFGRCLESLRWNQQHPQKPPRQVPYRDSKLTRLFQDYFDGNGKATMIVNVSPCSSDYDETFHVLRFSAVAKEVSTAVTRIDTGRVIQRFPRSTTGNVNSNTLGIEEGIEQGMVPCMGSLAVEDVTTAFDCDPHLREESNHGKSNRTEIDDEKEGKHWNSNRSAPITSSNRARENDLQTIGGSDHDLQIDREQIEAEIREEVANEFASRVEELEKWFTRRLAEESALTEDRYERKIEFLQRIHNSDNNNSEGAEIIEKLRKELGESQEHVAVLERDLKKLRETISSLEETLTTVRAEKDTELCYWRERQTLLEGTSKELQVQLENEKRENETLLARIVELSTKFTHLTTPHTADPSILTIAQLQPVSPMQNSQPQPHSHSPVQSSPPTSSIGTTSKRSKPAITPTKKELMKYKKLEVLDVVPSLSNGALHSLHCNTSSRNGVLTDTNTHTQSPLIGVVYRGDVEKSVSGTGVSVTFTDVESLLSDSKTNDQAAHTPEEMNRNINSSPLALLKSPSNCNRSVPSGSGLGKMASSMQESSLMQESSEEPDIFEDVELDSTKEKRQEKKNEKERIRLEKEERERQKREKKEQAKRLEKEHREQEKQKDFRSKAIDSSQHILGPSNIRLQQQSPTPPPPATATIDASGGASGGESKSTKSIFSWRKGKDFAKALIKPAGNGILPKPATVTSASDTASGDNSIIGLPTIRNVHASSTVEEDASKENTPIDVSQIQTKALRADTEQHGQKRTRKLFNMDSNGNQLLEEVQQRKLEVNESESKSKQRKAKTSKLQEPLKEIANKTPIAKRLRSHQIRN